MIPGRRCYFKVRKSKLFSIPEICNFAKIDDKLINFIIFKLKIIFQDLNQDFQMKLTGLLPIDESADLNSCLTFLTFFKFHIEENIRNRIQTCCVN
jgi:hypothetical protein